LAPRSTGTPANGPCTLRAAIMQANFDLENSPGSGPYTIQLGTDTYDLTIINNGTHDDASLRGDLDVNHGMTIQGNGPANTIVDGSHLNCETTDRVFHVHASGAPVLFNGFSIQGGHAHGNVAKTPPFCPNGFRARPSGNGSLGPAQLGGGILNDGSALTLTNMAVRDNEAGIGGGGVYSTGPLSVTGSLIQNNLVGVCDNQGFTRPRSQGEIGNNHVGGGIGSTGPLDINGESEISNNQVRGRLAENQGPQPRSAGVQSEIGAQGGGVWQTNGGSMSDTLVENNDAILIDCEANRRTRGSRSTGFSSANGLAQGGGIYNAGALTLTEVTVGQETLNQEGFSGNSAGRGGGIYNNTGGPVQRTGEGAPLGVTMVDSTVQGNLAGLSGGGVHNNGFLDSDNSDMIGNVVVGFVFGPPPSRASGISTNAGGGLFNEGDAIIQNNSLVGDPAPGGFDFVGNSAIFGGGIFNSFGADLVVASSSVDGNEAAQGGGIWNTSAADVVDDSTVSFNTAGAFQSVNRQPNGRATGDVDFVGGGIYSENPFFKGRSSGNGAEQVFIEESTLEGNVAESGGGIANGGSMHISKSTLHHNAARQDENGCPCRRPSPRAQGPGPIAVGGGLLNSGFARVDNSTFSANEAENQGGGIFVDFGDLDLLHVTLADNSINQPEPLSGAGDSPPGGGLVDFSGDTSTYQGTLFANNTPANCAGFPSALNSQGQNLADDASCLLDDPDDFAVVPDALLGPLDDNGGPTLTHLPAANSPAVDRITGECAVSDDQRSQARPQGTGCDVGAVEVGGPSPSPSLPPPSPGPSPSASGSPSPSPSPSPTPEPECPGFEGDPRNDVVGTAGVDELDGTPEDDIICAFEGDDILRGFEGNDLMLAGPDDDRSFGGEGDDRIRSSTGNDRSYGHEGQDEVRGGRGEDTIEGDEGDDLLRGYENDDDVRGGPGDDRVLGFPGDDKLHGDEGDDFIKGGVGNDDLNGGANNDDCEGGKGQDTIQNCEQGSPRAVADRRSGV
jgi:RTX calcium-binding nonapeptide repeat (4 copies)